MLTDRDAATMRVIEELKRIYKSKILPLERTYLFDIFHVPLMSDAEFDSKPQIMLIGQYSVGKTTVYSLKCLAVSHVFSLFAIYLGEIFQAKESDQNQPLIVLLPSWTDLMKE